MQNNVLSVIKMEMGQFYLCLLSACNSTFTFRDVTEQLIRPIIRTKPFYDKNIRIALEAERNSTWKINLMIKNS